MTDGWDSIGIMIVYASLILIILSIVLYKQFEIKYNKSIFILMYLFVFFSFLAALFNGDAKLFVKAIMFFVLFLSTNIIIPSLLKGETVKILAKLILITHIPLLLIPIIIDRGINHVPYTGLFDNTNLLGSVIATVLAVFSAFFFRDVEDMLFKVKVPKKSTLFYMFCIFSLLLLITYTTSRTSFITSLLVLLAGFTLIFIKAVKYKKIGNLIVKGLFAIPGLFIASFVLNLFFPLKESIIDNVVSKFDRKSNDILDGRGDIWKGALQEIGFFGGGNDVFSGQIALGSHNTFLSVLGMFGWVPLVILIIFFIIAAFNVIKHTLTSGSKYKYFPFLMLVNFLSMSMTEDMLYKISMLSALSLSGFCMNKTKLTISNKFTTESSAKSTVVG